MSIIDTLVTDRTQKDVANGTGKGYYNYTDLNRVNAAAAYLVEELEGAGYAVPGFSAQQEWGMSSIPTVEKMDEYLRNIRVIRDVLSVNSSIPSSMSFLGYIGANNIEKALVEVENRLLSLRRVFVRCNAPTAYSGLGYYIDKSGESIILKLLCDSAGVLLCSSDGMQLVSR